MNKAGKFLVAVAAVALIGGAATACGNDNDGVEYVYVNGYYDVNHHYHVYPTPRAVTLKYYNSHKSSYPKPNKTVKITPPKGVNKGTGSKVGGSSGYKKSGGGSSYKAPRSSNRGTSSGRRR